MISSLFSLDALGTPTAFFFALIIGGAFGFALERAGFSSSRKLAGLFYFRDMTVLKVMFTALITAMLGLGYLTAFGWIAPGSVYLLPTILGAQVIGGLIFGVGFVMGGWCPGTAAAGLACGKLDALLFLGGAVVGTILFNEFFPLVKPLYTWGDRGVQFIFEDIGISRTAFALLFTVAAVCCFWVAEYVEKRVAKTGHLWNSPFLKALSLALVVVAVGLFILPTAPRPGGVMLATARSERSLLDAIAAGQDHIEPEELAQRIVSADPSLVLIDVRTPAEYAAFHLRGAANVPIPDLPSYLAPQKNQGTVVLYSNGMTHPAQARDALQRLGFQNVYLLTDGLAGFIERCLKPVSLRAEPPSAGQATKVNAWRRFFLAEAEPTEAPATAAVDTAGLALPGTVSTEWLAANLGRPGLKVIDLRTQPEYNTGHVPGSLFLSVETFRGVVKGVPSMLLPADILARLLSSFGIEPSDLVVLVSGERVHDATLVGMVFERLGHRSYAILDGGFGRWVAEGRALNTQLPVAVESRYPVNWRADDFTADYQSVLNYVRNGGAVIIDVRPADYYRGERSEEARAGHIPGAINRPYTEDVAKAEGSVKFKPVAELAAAYAALIPSTDATVVVHCRTGHQASQTFFVLKRLLGYRNVLYYDAGWTEWAARPELPVEQGAAK